jgi:hypothetical protein
MKCCEYGNWLQALLTNNRLGRKRFTGSKRASFFCASVSDEKRWTNFFVFRDGCKVFEVQTSGNLCHRAFQTQFTSGHNKLLRCAYAIKHCSSMSNILGRGRSTCCAPWVLHSDGLRTLPTNITLGCIHDSIVSNKATIIVNYDHKSFTAISPEIENLKLKN